MAKKNWVLSASLMSTAKSCFYRCYMKYVLGIIPALETDSLRQGSTWHSLLEIMKLKPGTVCPECANKSQKNPNCALCEGTDFLPDDMMDAVIRHLDKVYEEVPVSKTKEEWETEKIILLYSLSAYNWYYSDDDYEVLATEVPFNIPLINPASGRALPNVCVKGKIDKLTRSPEGIIYVDEHKSASKSIDSESSYWKHLTLDSQTTLYPYAAQYLQQRGELEQYGIKATDPLICGVRYDVWHKPTIKPKKLTQAGSKQFVEDGKYCSQEFGITQGDDGELLTLCINDTTASIEWGAEPKVKKDGAKTTRPFAIRETPEMYGARLLQDITERPTFYFMRQEINRTETDINFMRRGLVGLYHCLKFLDKNDAWFTNEQQCEATFKCPYVDYCYAHIVPDAKKPIEGFKCIFNKKEI